MKKVIYVLILPLFVVSGQFLCFGQIDLTKREFERIQLKSVYESRFYELDADRKLLESEAINGEGIIIQNSFPKGNRYKEELGYVIFWTRVINETATPLELKINFPADSYAIPPTSYSYLKLFMLQDTMKLEKESLYDYGATGLKSFLDTGLDEPTMLQKTINPKEEYIFYIGALSHQAGGTVRAGLVLKEQNLFYKIGIAPHFDSRLYPCGHVILTQ